MLISHRNAIVFFVLTVCSMVSHAEENKSRLLTNVPYGDVLSLSYEPPTRTMTYGDNSVQFGHLWLPENPTMQTPLVIFIHGGCWLNAFDVSHSMAMTSAIAEQGYVVWSIEYRRTGDSGGGWPGTLNDINKAVEFIVRQDDVLFDRQKVIFSGHSAGGHLALLAAQNAPFETKVVGLAAITDIRQYARGNSSCQKAAVKFMGGSESDKPDEYRAATPMQFNHTYLLFGGKDPIVGKQQAKFVTDDRGQVTPVFIDSAGHFDYLHPHSQAFATMMKTFEKVVKP